MKVRLTVTYEAEDYGPDSLHRGAAHIADLKLPNSQQWVSEGTMWFLKSVAITNAEGEKR